MGSTKRFSRRSDKEIAVEHAFERIPPQNNEAEMAVLGCMLIEEEAISTAIEHVTPEDFYKDAHKTIYAGIVKLYDERKAVDIITLVERLKSENVLEAVGGAGYLAGLTNVVPTAANVAHYARIVKEKHVLRLLIQHATQIVTEAYSTEENVTEVLDRAERAIFEIADRRAGQNAILPLKELVKESMEVIDRLHQNKKHVTGIPTGFADLDIMTAGLQNSDLIIIAGRPSMGKSAFAINVLEHAALIEKAPVAFFSLEMSKEQLTQRLLCSQARVDAGKVRTGFLSTEHWRSLADAAGKLSEAAFYIDDTPAISVLELRAKARRLKAQHDIKLVALDYMQIMRGSPNAESRQQEISEISRSLKALARELNIPVIAISQLSRAVESRTDHKPQLSDLRESGAIEQDADVVILLSREEYYNPTEQNRGIAEINVAKQRNGATGILKMTFIREFTRFENLAVPGQSFGG